MIRNIQEIYSSALSINIESKTGFIKLVKNRLEAADADHPASCFYLNAGSLFYMLSDGDFLKALKSATHLYLNSDYIKLFLQLLHGKKVSKLNAEDFIYDLFKLGASLRRRVFLLGSDNKALETSLTRLKKEYPHLEVGGHHGYFKSGGGILTEINQFEPDVLLVGLGLGNQEKWVAQNIKNLGKTKLVVTFGNFIDILGGKRGLPPPLFKKYKLEWLYRLCKEPRRLWKRYLFGGLIVLSLFIVGVLRALQRLVSKAMERVLALFFLLLSLPLLLIFYPLVKLESSGPFIFKQKRAGKNKKIFTIYKIRTMFGDAEKLKEKYLYLNEEERPVFKIRDDPRYTKVGKFLSHLGLDEIPQFVNVIRGEMSLVGPRPLPPEEAQAVPRKYQVRFSVLPGITSPWIIKGAHKLKFKRWMELDLEYIKKRSFGYDLYILLKTAVVILELVLIKFFFVEKWKRTKSKK